MAAFQFYWGLTLAANPGWGKDPTLWTELHNIDPSVQYRPRNVELTSLLSPNYPLVHQKARVRVVGPPGEVETFDRISLDW